jgi:aryl-phospho-beta-D-glucosidase BglC (GH1 family)
MKNHIIKNPVPNVSSWERCAGIVCKKRLPLVAALCLAFLPSSIQAENRFLKANGRDLRSDSGAGQVVTLRGVNLGSLYVYEQWMSPMANSTSPTDQWGVENVLTTRFGDAGRDQLLNAWRDNWMAPSDYERIARRGMNCIRVPLWYGAFEDDNGNPRDGFTRLDAIINAAWAQGIYTIIDLHGAYGGQSGPNSHASGRKQENPPFWNNDLAMYPAGSAWDPYNVYIQRTENLWQRIAQRYVGNPAVAGYDILNEPVGAPNRWGLMNVYNRLYQKIRAVDPDHVIFMEACWSGWDWGNDGTWKFIHWEMGVLQPPGDRGWTNVVYSLHQYDSGRGSIDNRVQDYLSKLSWNVPCHIGEFNTFGDNDAFIYAVDQFNSNDISWNMWSYKAVREYRPPVTQTGNTDSWGMYNFAPASPLWNNRADLNNDSFETILAKWSSFGTSGFINNTALDLVFKSPVPVFGGHYVLEAAQSNKALSINKSSRSDGAVTEQRTASGSGTSSQQWRADYMGGGLFRLTARHSGKVLDVNASSIADGAKTQQWTSSGNAATTPGNQRWRIEDLGGGNCRITAAHSGKVLGVTQASTAEKAVVNQQTDNLANHQMWKFRSVP